MRPLHALAMASAVLVALPALSLSAAADPWKDESGHGRRHHHYKGKQVFYDGPCKIERKWKGNGGYKEDVECGGYAYGPVYDAYPAYPVYGDPPPVVVPGGPTITVTIPLD